MTTSSDVSPVSEGAHRLRIDRSAMVSAGVPRRRWVWRVLLLLAGLVLLGSVWWWRSSPEVQATAVMTALPSQQAVTLTASGYVVAQRRAAVASKATGRLVALNVREGSLVKAGQVLARLDASDVQAALASAQAGVMQAQANLHQAQTEFDNAQEELRRSEAMVAQGFISPQALDAVRTRRQVTASAVAAARSAVMAAQAQVKAQQVNEDFTEIRAPFDGVVLVKNANVGDIITPFSSAAGSQGAVVTMADMTTLEVEADVSESQLAKVSAGQPVEVVLDALPDERFRGVVGGVVPTVDRAKATVTTKIRFEQLDPRILPEMSAKVNFLSRPVTAQEQRPVLAVSPSALPAGVKSGQLSKVWQLVPDGVDPKAGPSGPTAATGGVQRVQPVAVRVGRVLGDMVEIAPTTAGKLKTGDRLAQVSGAGSAVDAAAWQAQQRVRVLTDKP